MAVICCCYGCLESELLVEPATSLLDQSSRIRSFDLANQNGG